MNRSSRPGQAALLSTCLLVILAGFGASTTHATAPEPGISALEIMFPSLPPELRPLAEGAPPEAVERLIAMTGVTWEGTWDATQDRIDRLLPAGLQLVQPFSGASEIDRLARTFLAEHPLLFGAEESDLATIRIKLAGGVWWVTYQQVLSGFPVLGARIDLRLDENGYLLFVQDRTIRGLDLPPAGLTATEAERRATDALLAEGEVVTGIAPPVPGITELGTTAEVLVAVPDEASGRIQARRAWRIRQDLSGRPARFRSYIDVQTGEILSRTNELHYVTAEGTVEGDQQPLEPTDPFVRSPFEHLKVSVEGIGSDFTDASGHWQFDFPDGDPRNATARLEGEFVNVNRVDGLDAELSGVADPGNPLAFVFEDANSHAAERDVYYHASLAHDYMKQIDPAFTDIDYIMPARVNINSTCNAYWDGYGINFFKEGGGCANTGQIADVVYHEYGHGATQYAYAPGSPSGAMHEGFSDYLANTITDQSKVGLGFFGPGTWLRDSDNDRTWPAPECGGEPHCLGEVIAGALWHMRENLIDEIGDHATAVALSDNLFHFARFGGNNDFEGYYFDLLAVDDDNGTLVDGTPHGLSIVQAFGRHNIGPGLVLEILHEPLGDTDQPNEPIPVLAVFASADQVLEDSLAVYYSTEPIGGGLRSGPTRLQMIPTGEIREYTASIPGQPIDTRVRYYISGVTEALGLVDTDPDGAPENQHEFLVALDLSAPVIEHDPKTERSRHVWPVPLEATVTDNQGVATVLLEYRINGVDRTPVVLTPQGADLYTGNFGGSVAVGDLVEYRIKAADIAETPNVAFLPETGYFEIPIVQDIETEFEDGVQDWTHTNGTDGFIDQWHLSTQRNHTLGGSWSWKFGDTGGGDYADGADGVLEMLPVSLGPGASMRFWHWIAAEVYGQTTAWDGALVEISTDDGASWEPLIPIDGYTHTIVDNPASPFPGGYPVWSGFFDWRLAEFDLSPYEGTTIRLRWRFGSDGAVTYEGWYIDDLILVTTTDESTGAEETADLLPSRTSLVGIVPNPFNPRTAIRFGVAPGTGPLRLAIHDASGRLVRTLVDQDLQPGMHEVVWGGLDDQGRPVSTGVYFARIHARGVNEALKLLLLK